MRSAFDFTPYRQSWIGYDHLFDLLENARQHETKDFPPFDLEQSEENAYRLRIAVAGFPEDSLEITAGSNLLVVSGRAENTERKWLYRGIAGGDFERQFQLADYVVVTGARLVNGVLEIELERQLPDAIKPRKIAIGTPVAAETGAKRRQRAGGATKPGAPAKDNAPSEPSRHTQHVAQEPVLTGAW